MNTGDVAPPVRLFGRVLAPDDLGLAVVEVETGRISALSAASEAPDDAIGGPDALVVPGFIDLQLNGAFGHDFSDPSADVAAVCAALPRHGVTAFLPTVISSPPERYRPCLANLATTRRPDATAPGRSRVLGVHLEGPFLAREQVGTHDPAATRPPDLTEALGWLDAGSVRLVTLAPELPGALPLIAALAGRGVVVAAGHSGASWAEAEAGMRAGIRLGTHLFNAMRPFHHRDPGIAGFLLASDLPVSVIGDGRHIVPETLRLVARAKGPERLVCVTDALAGLGMPPGSYVIAGRRVVTDGTVAGLADGTLSGSVTPLPRMVANLVAAGIPAADAVRAVTANPARVLGLDAELGHIRIGAPADLVVLDADWSVRATFVGGTSAWRAEVAGA
jgi:N-acetylglucosamine-6-phosphate deacetylase